MIIVQALTNSIFLSLGLVYISSHIVIQAYL